MAWGMLEGARALSGGSSAPASIAPAIPRHELLHPSVRAAEHVYRWTRVSTAEAWPGTWPSHRAAQERRMNRRDLRTSFVVLALAALAACSDETLSEVREPITLPSNFTDALVASVTKPTALAFLPDGTLLITSQSGSVRVFKN